MVPVRFRGATSGVLARLTEADLLSTFQIQGYSVTGLEAVYQVAEHFGVRGKDLGLYRELDRTGRSSV
jgi:hypothetical protein